MHFKKNVLLFQVKMLTIKKERKRAPNFSGEEELALVTAIEKNQEVLFGKFEGEKVSNFTKNKAWLSVTDAVNAVGGNDRKVKEIVAKHKNLKTTTKKTESDNRREIVKTGGGKAKIKPLNEAQQVILRTIPESCIAGLPNGIDLHDTSNNSKYLKFNIEILFSKKCFKICSSCVSPNQLRKRSKCRDNCNWVGLRR